MKRLIWLPVAGFLLVAGATVAAAAPSLVGISPAAQSLDDSDVSEFGRAGHARPGALVEDVLADLVAQGVITQDQSDAITEAIATRVEDQRAEFEARRDQMRATFVQIRGFLDDGVITQDEIDQLPADNPLRTVFDSIARDGQVTVEQLRELRPGGGPGHSGHGPDFHPAFDGPADAEGHADAD